MPYPTGQVLSAPITNGSSIAQFGTHIDFLGTGGYRSVATLADRDAIPIKSALEYDGLGSGMRRHLMLVAVQETGLIYILYKPGFQAINADSQKLAALKDNTNWLPFTDFLNIESGSAFIQDEFSEFIATTNGVQNIVLPMGANAVIDIKVIEILGGVRGVYQKHYSVSNSILTISSEANIIAGDKICGTYYIKNGASAPPNESLVIVDVQGDEVIIITSVQSS